MRQKDIVSQHIESLLITNHNIYITRIVLNKSKVRRLIVKKLVVLFIITLLICSMPVMAADLKDIKLGDFVTFGAYEQDNDLDNGPEPIEWEVLDVQDGKALLFSRYALDCQPYNVEFQETTWETCTLRTWLNEDFFGSAFDDLESELVVETVIVNDDHPYYETEGGNNTNDRVFLLSLEEIGKYYGIGLDSDECEQPHDNLKCRLTEYGKERFIPIWAQDFFDGSVERAEERYQNGVESYGQNYCRMWWLRSIGSTDHYAILIDEDGYIHWNGGDVDGASSAVRPAIWISTE